jgi:hypothetical protein
MKAIICFTIGFVLSSVWKLSAATLYVSQASTNPVPPYAAWATAATNIQDAIDAATTVDTVLVTNGIYHFGGHAVGTNQLVNRMVLDKPIQVASVKGPKVTIIQGYQVPGTVTGDGAIRCAYLANGAVLSGFTLRNGATRNSGDVWADQSGGGAFCGGTITNCILAANTAASGGGGVAGGIVNNCIITGNFAANGGGANGSWLNNCLIVSNSASQGGGTWISSIDNCTVAFNSAAFGGGGVIHLSGDLGVETNSIIYYNTAPSSPNFLNVKPRGWDALQFCCTTPLPGWPSSGCITNEPLFVNLLSGGDFHLQATSPCINSGNNGSVIGTTDLDGNPRIVGSTVDIGAYEFQKAGSMISHAWLQKYGLATDGSADFIDSDGDGMNNWQEWVCGTDPTNALSVLRLLSAVPIGNKVTVSWQSVPGVSYFLVRSSDVGSSFALGPGNADLVATNIVGTTETNSYTDTNANGIGLFFYRVGVKGP